MKFLKLFNRAGATGHVFLLKGGNVRNMGIAYSGLIGPMTTVAVVPTTPRILDFSVEARTKDKQKIVVAGNIKIVLDPAVAVSKFDFTVTPEKGSYLSQWEQELRAIVIERVLAPIHDKARALDVEIATQSHRDFEEALKVGITSTGSPLAGKGITVESCSIVKVAADEEVNQAIGAKERQEMLTQADKALHGRRLKASENERNVRTFEAETALRLEEERAKLVEKQSANKQLEATADAEATKKRLEVFKDAEPGIVLGAALMKMADRGVGNLSIVPELFTVLNGQTRK